MGSHNGVAVRAEEDVVLRHAGNVNLAPCGHNHVRHLLSSDTASAYDPLERAVHAVEFGNEHLGIGYVQGGAPKVGFTREVPCNDHIAGLVHGNGLGDAGVG